MDGVHTATLAYNDANQLVSESHLGGTLAGLTVTSGFDNKLRRETLFLDTQTSDLNYTYGYDPLSGRLQTVSDGTHKATYGYLANSPLVSTVTFEQNTTPRMTTTKAYDFLNRVESVSSLPSGAGQRPISYAYLYNEANQRRRTGLADGSYWLYEYDSLGQVRSGRKLWSDGTPVAGQQFEYTHDDIGNRTSTLVGGDENGSNLRLANYTPNALNQYAMRDVPRQIDITGIALGGAAVTVTSPNALNNLVVPYRKIEYFRKELSYDAGAGHLPLWETVTVSASGETDLTGKVFLPQTPENFTYDLDGNLTSDGRWTYTWDAENRLIRMVAATAVGPQERIDFVYDYQGRRISKWVWWNSTSGSGQPNVNVNFVYDGWNLLAELAAYGGNSLVRSYVWGLDLSGSEEGVGGVGGLLAVNDAANGVHFCAYDGNGNVMALVKATDGTVSADYEYGPFGELIRATGPMAKTNPFRFSTKYQDEETDLLYYGYRYYNPVTGRWPNRDPLGDIAFLYQYARRKPHREATRLMQQALMPSYAFVGNRPTDLFDPFGLDESKDKDDKGKSWDDPHSWVDVHYSITYCCNGKTTSKSGYTTIENAVNALKSVPANCEIVQYQISSHCDGTDIWGKPKGGRVSLDDLVNGLDPSRFGNGACVDLNFCHGELVAPKIEEKFNNAGKKLCLEYTTGENRNIPGLPDIDYPGGGGTSKPKDKDCEDCGKKKCGCGKK